MHHTETRTLPFTLEQLFALVADIESYPAFLPWCVAARITKKESEQCLFADLAIGYKGLREKYTSRVTFDPPNPYKRKATIDVEMVEGPFSHLINHWRFDEAENNSTIITFDIDFTFRSKLLQMMMGGLFEKASVKMIEAFEERAESLYAAPR